MYTDWGAYSIPENQADEFDRDLEILESLPFQDYHINLDRFTQKWYEYRINK